MTCSPSSKSTKRWAEEGVVAVEVGQEMEMLFQIRFRREEALMR